MSKLVRQINHDIVEALAARKLEGFPNRRAVQDMLRNPAWEAGLEALFFQQTPGVLILPGHSAVTAHFSRLGWLGQGDGQVLRYSFEFLERLG